MKDSENKAVGSYPQWLEFIGESYSDAFTQVFLKLDKLLSAEFGFYSPGSLYNQMSIILAEQLEGNAGTRKIVVANAIKTTLFKSLRITCGEFNMSPKYLRKNKLLSDTVNELQTILIEMAVMVQMQDSFDELNRLPINAN